MRKETLVLIFCATVYGLNIGLSKFGMNAGLTPNFYTAVRFTLGFLVLLAINFRHLKDNFSWKLLYGGILTGLVIGIGNLLNILGLSMTTAAKAAFLASLSVAMTPVMEWFIRKRKPLVSEIIGLVLSVVGLGLLSLQNDFTISFGDLLELLAAFLFSVGFFCTEKYSKATDSRLLTLVEVGTTVVIGYAVAFATEPLPTINMFNTTTILVICFSGCMSVALGTSLQFWAQKTVSSGVAAVIMIIEPIVAALLGAALLRELLSMKEFTGIVFMLIGMLVIILGPDMKNKKAQI